MEQEILERTRRGRMRIIGPNCLGVMSPLTGLKATFAGAMARPAMLALSARVAHLAPRFWIGAWEQVLASAPSFLLARWSM